MKLDASDGFLLFGVLVIMYGVAMIYIPAAVIVGGLLISGVALLSAGRAKR